MTLRVPAIRAPLSAQEPWVLPSKGNRSHTGIGLGIARWPPVLQCQRTQRQTAPASVNHVACAPRGSQIEPKVDGACPATPRPTQAIKHLGDQRTLAAFVKREARTIPADLADFGTLSGQPITPLRGQAMRPPRSRLAQQRTTAGYTQEALAYEVGVDRSTVARWESGETEPQPWLRLKLARVLGVTAARLSELLAASARMAPPAPGATARPDAAANRSVAALAPLRRAMLRDPVDQPTAPVFGPAGVYPDIRTATVAVHTQYQRADYEAAGQLVPLVVSHLDDPSHSTGGDQPPPILQITSAAYLAAAKIANKLGDISIALLAADRALRYAKEARHSALIALANGQFACALLRANHGEDAEQIAANAAERLALAAGREQTAEIISAQGALLLLLAVIAGLRGDGIAAKLHLGKADDLANRLGDDGNWLWTGFGPTNVRIHELAVLVGLGESKRALQLGPVINTDRLPTVLRGRRSQVHVELAQAAAGQADDGLSVLHLLEAERVATQTVSHHAQASGLLRMLLGRERKGAIPGLRALATRVGVLS